MRTFAPECLLAASLLACRGPTDVVIHGGGLDGPRIYELRVCRAGELRCASVGPGALPGDCEYDEPLEGSDRAIGELADELYLFIALARSTEDCEIIGYACEEVSGRSGDRLDLTLAPASDVFCAPGEMCAAGACVDEQSDDAGMDSSVDAYIADAGADARVPDVGVDGGNCMDDPVVDVAAGGNHTCAVTCDGRVYCWGANEWGQLGAEGEHDTPVLVAGLEDVVAVDVEAGAFHTCARDGAGAVYCWGRNHYGQIGDGSSIDNIPNPFASRVLLIDDAAELALGFIHSCVRRATGEMRCWGQNESGELGRGDAETRMVVSTPDMPVLGGADTVVIAAGDGPVCAARGVARTLQCWGYNAHGKVGTGTTTPYQYNEPQYVTPRLSDVQDVSAGGYADYSGTAHAGHVCAIVGTDAFCWGRNDQGQLGNDEQDSQSSVARLATAPEDFRQIAAGGHHTCAITVDRVNLYCWGDNEFGQRGETPDLEDDDSDQPARVTSIATAIGADLDQVTTGRNHTCVRAGGQVWCWGDDSEGQLGDGSPGGFSDTPGPVVVRAE